ncbi:MAG: gephyrin-like molybdotransferase Glp [Desulfopila sp.]
MITVQEALSILQRNLPVPRVIDQPLTAALLCRLAEDIVAPEPSPRYTSSAMDGYGVRWQDVATAGEQTPVRLTVAGESQAGVPYEETVRAGQAIRISTGAMLPEGADTVVRVEDTRERDGEVEILQCRSQGQDVRRAGEEFAVGSLLLKQGQILHPRQLALLAAVGVDRVPVYAAPRVSLLITGTELAHYGDGEIKPFQVRDSNTVMLQSAVIESGGALVDSLHVKDDLASTVAAMNAALANRSDIILCSGGVSVGRHDHVKEAALEVGFAQLFWRIKQKPGKPLFVARKGEVLLFGLPGNPVSAFMCFMNYVTPCLAAMLGVPYLKKSISAAAEVTIESGARRTDFIRVVVTDEPNTVPTIRPILRQGSHMLTSIVEADGYIVVEPGTRLVAGDLTEVFLF